ncbi:MAG: TadE/TadG family type IV pilus assembly protein [Clostridiaceae bacterium]|nr:TadE/TadG family type IV pilus assembly protein [Clostridiaceae bacterium]
MKCHHTRRNRHEDGQAAVEFALTLPIVLLLLVGILELGWVSANAMILENITREGVRAGIIATDTSLNNEKISQRIQDMAPDYFGSIDVTITYSDPADFRAGDVTVVTHYALPAITPLSGLITEGGVFYLEASCTMKMS